ncbi:MAG: formate dehydrogenase accessory sulfurtransferase FdhD [Deltaproteobacteria bacterium]|nr:formate dehydrogenase accessory sulfurtransferase FdhD [Deltaproteobacteria bacterium]
MRKDASRGFEVRDFLHNKRPEGLRLIQELPLEVRLPGLLTRRTLRTPGDDEALAVGVLLGQGLVRTPADLKSLALDPSGGSVTCQITADPPACRVPRALPSSPALDAWIVASMAADLRERQGLHPITRSTHAVAVFAADGTMLSLGEDVGRHNAMDKAMGRAFLEGSLPRAAAVVLTCRINAEAVRKAALAGLCAMASISRPTVQAVLLGRRLGMGLALVAPEPQVLVFSGGQRFTPATPSATFPTS